MVHMLYEHVVEKFQLVIFNSILFLQLKRKCLAFVRRVDCMQIDGSCQTSFQARVILRMNGIFNSCKLQIVRLMKNRIEVIECYSGALRFAFRGRFQQEFIL